MKILALGSLKHDPRAKCVQIWVSIADYIQVRKGGVTADYKGVRKAAQDCD
jgi:hypothetical protein